MQNFRAKDHTAMAAAPDAGFDDFLATVAVARLVLGPGMRIQAPPNLVSRAECLALLGAGVDDWGGVSPLTPTTSTPERPWPALDELAAVTAEGGFELMQRLTAQPRYVQAGSAWIDPRVQAHVAALADPTPAWRATSTRWAGRGRSPTRPRSRWGAPIFTRPSTPRAAYGDPQRPR